MLEICLSVLIQKTRNVHVITIVEKFKTVRKLISVESEKLEVA